MTTVCTVAPGRRPGNYWVRTEDGGSCCADKVLDVPQDILCGLENLTLAATNQDC